MKKIFILLAATSALVSACNNSDKSGSETVTVITTDTSGANKGSVSDMDRDFAAKVSMANMTEVEAGTIAERRGNDAGVKEYGKLMQTDHTAAQSELKGIATALSLNIPGMLDSLHRNMNQKLNGLSGKNFDSEYITMMIKDHRDAVALFESEASSGGHQQLKDFAGRILPHLRMHLQKADSLAMRLKITP